jgi:hypothetical protein
MVFDPLRTAVGRAFTVTTALPVISAGNDEHLLSFTAVSVYVFVVDGDTAKVYVLVLTLLTVIGMVPSVYVMLHGALPVKMTVNVVD